MRIVQLFNNYASLRWVLLGVGLLAILGLTGMNVYSLYALHEKTITANRENKESRLTEFGQQVRNRFYAPFRGFSKLNMNHLDKKLRRGDVLPDDFKEVIIKASNDSLYSEIYFSPSDLNPCRSGDSMFKFNPVSEEFTAIKNYPDLVCDGMGIAQTRMRVLIEDYRWNNKVIFDTHRSMTIAAINLHTNTVVGYFTFVVDQEYLKNHFLHSLIRKKFKPHDESGVVVWVHDWTKDEIIASSDPSVPLEPGKVQIHQKFPNLFDNWNMKMMFTENPVFTTSEANLFRNLTILGAAVLVLIGALVFIFVTAIREKELATRQAGFLANVTHELKTPLAVMQAAGENLADGRVSNQDRLHSYGKHIYEEAIRLRNMIDKLLDVAKTDADESMVELKPHYLGELVDKYLETHKNYFADKGFELEYSRPKDDCLVMVDKDSIETILGNLTENAIKYSRDDRYIGLALTTHKKKAYLKLTDHGVGIDKKAQKFIFDKFYRAEDTLTAETKGHGLGLSIVRNLVELNNGSINVESQVGEGTTFTIEFPVILDSKTGKLAAKAADQSSSLNHQKENYVG